MIVSAISLWKKFNLNTALCVSEWDILQRKSGRWSRVAFNGHAVDDGTVRVYARFCKPKGTGKHPAVLLLPEAGALLDDELCAYFLSKGYAVLMPDYSGKMPTDTDTDFRTVYPPSLSYGNLSKARGLTDMQGLEAHQTTWFEWLYVCLYSLRFLKQREDITSVGVVGIRTGGDLAWQTMLSPDVACGVPINSAGWKSFSSVAKFGDDVARHLPDEVHSYIAAVEAQSYAPYVKCPVLMLCAIRDNFYDCDRAYDTYSRIGNRHKNALAYSARGEACIGPNGLYDMDLFLEKHLKGREIFIPSTLNVALKETADGLEVEVTGDKEGLLEHASVYYAEADVKTKCAYRDWRRVHRVKGKETHDNKFTCTIKPFAGASAVFVYASAKYINGFRVASKITAKRLSNPDKNAVKSRKLLSAKETEGLSVAEYKENSIGNIFLETDAIPKLTEGYGGIYGSYSLGGVKLYKISSPMFIPDEGAMLAFDTYFHKDDEICVSVEAGDVNQETAKYTCSVPVKSGGKWKRIILKADEFKDEKTGKPLRSFADGRALVFDCGKEGTEFGVTNVLWL